MQIVEKDQEAGYVLFKLIDDDKEFDGSMELARTKDSRGREATRVFIAIPGRPDYVGDAILERLRLKLLEEYGDPPPPPPRAKDPPKTDPPKSEATD